MRIFHRTLSTAILLALTSLGMTGSALAQRSYRESDASIRNLIQRIETRSDTLKRSIDVALDRSRLNGTASEDEINRLVADFEAATNQLRNQFESRRSTATDVRLVLERANHINRFIFNNRLGNRVQQDWSLLQSDLDQLARAYFITGWNWRSGGVGGVPGPAYGLNNAQLRQLVRRIETEANQLNMTMSPELNRAPISSRERQEIRQRLSDLETAATTLRNELSRRSTDTNSVQNLLRHASYIDQFVSRNQLSARTENDWNVLRGDLSQLASAYNVAWNSNDTPGPIYGSARLTGTYRLNPSQSGNARQAAETATRNLPAGQRQRVYESLVRRLDAPDMLAIDQQGTNVTIASTRAPQINFVADGREHVETTPNGRTVRIRSSLSGDQLSIVRTGERAQDFTVTFDPTDDGRRLIVTRTLYADQLNQPAIVTSHYDRTSDVAQLDIYRGDTDLPTTATGGDFVIPNGTRLEAELDTPLTTETARESDRFTLRVTSPSQYAGATIEGYVQSVNRSGRVTGRSELTLNFDNVRMPDGRTYRFAGIVEGVRTPGGETVRVDNEGAVREDDQTGRTVTRTAIGTAVGAIIGAIAGGGKGAAIGAAIGAGAGAGSVYIQGREDLELPAGTDVTIVSTSPTPR